MPITDILFGDVDGLKTNQSALIAIAPPGSTGVTLIDFLAPVTYDFVLTSANFGGIYGYATNLAIGSIAPGTLLGDTIFSLWNETGGGDTIFKITSAVAADFFTTITDLDNAVSINAADAVVTVNGGTTWQWVGVNLFGAVTGDINIRITI